MFLGRSLQVLALQMLGECFGNVLYRFSLYKCYNVLETSSKRFLTYKHLEMLPEHYLKVLALQRLEELEDDFGDCKTS